MPIKTQITVNVKTTPNTKEAATSTRDLLIEVGLELMRKHGYGATGLQEILEQAGVPKGSFYHHFGSKEEFAAVILERYAAIAGEHATGVLGSKRQAPLKRLHRYFEELIHMAGQLAPIQGCLLGSFSLEVAGGSTLLQDRLKSNFAIWQAIVATVLKEAVEKGDLRRSTKPEALAGFILNSWEGALLRSQADKSDAPLKDFLHFIFEELLASR